MLSGSLVAIITPMHEDGSIHFEKMGELIEYHIDNQTDGIVLLGTTGEASTMTFEEEKQLVSFAAEKIAKRVPLIVGSGSNNTVTAVENSKAFAEHGADMLLVVTPYYNRANEGGMVRHFEAIANSVDVPIILYNVPGRTGCSLSVSAVATLAKHPNIIGIKEASGDISYAVKLAPLLNDDFAMYSGNDDIIVPLLSLGAKGVISVWANIMPKEVHDLVSFYLEGRHQESLAIQTAYLDLVDALFYETNPIPVKHAMNVLGFGVGPLRMPLGEMDAPNYQKLVAVLAKYKEVWS